MDQLRALRVFVRVCDAGSFAQAARELDLAPAVVTRLVADLEARLSTRLLHRTTRRLTLTSAGAQYLEHTRQVLADLDEADAQVSRSTGEVRGLLRIAGPLPLLQLVVVPSLPQFRSLHPHLDLHLNVVPWRDQPEDSADVSLLIRDPRPLDGEFVARPLARAEVVLCATPDYLTRHGRPQHPAELDAHELLIPSVAGAPREWQLSRSAGVGGASQHAHAVARTRKAGVDADSAPVLLSLARAGLGIAATLSYLVADDLRTGVLERVLTDWSAGDFTLFAAMPSRQYLPQRVRVFNDFLAAQLGGGNHDPWRV